jgi:rfaE bifunctional protein kinase chain/domain
VSAPPSKKRLAALVDSFASARIAVVGDMLADIYIYGRPYRLSREAPVVVVKHEHEEVIPGGAANTANNLAALGAQVVPVGVLGDDEAGTAVQAQLAAANMDTSGLITSAGTATVSKTRIMAGGQSVSKQQVIRIDREGNGGIEPAALGALRAAVEGLRGRVDGVIVSDYDYAVCSPPVIAAIRALADDLPVLVDSHTRIREFGGATLATPNEGEMADAAGVDVNDEDALREAGRALREEVGLAALLITRGNRGMLLIEPDATHIIPIVGTADVADVTGAGDTVAAATMLGRVAGGSFLEAAWLANHAAGVVVMHMGAATLSADELRATIATGPGA